MMKNTHPTKEKVIQAAGTLFYQKGYHATSVRDIAKEAKVNISLISYYFDGKQGLFETIVIDHLEANLKLLEESQGEHFLTIVKKILHYKMDNYQLSCFVHREMMLDSTLLRELLVTYIAKEDSLWASILFQADDISDLRYGQELQLLQMKGMLQAPFTVPWYQRGERSSAEAKRYFIDKYVENMRQWFKGDPVE
ncbi:MULTISPECIES: forespore capture DNA-binding protein RefZ [Salimicrobium]|uniref:TetR family transcriptional regulator n=1 Tax=Salimicrobium humidisoli TaxID=2029857 RepID=A0ABX4HUG0_9BACI|nr:MULTISPECIES: forespore capture DNA-binding protein RefZ [Salimicrobium]PBB06688.1 TetR family transcriptional regulator [Salimicrobium humidisoli]